MKSIFFALIALVFVSFIPSTQAQTLSVAEKPTTILSNIKSLEKEALTNSISEESIFTSEENNIFYIDFEKINVNLNDITVKNEKDEVVFADKLWSLPVNTIYEVDLSSMKAGNYKIELRSFTGVHSKKVVLK